MFADTDLLLRDVRRSLDRVGAAYCSGLSPDAADREEHEALHDLAATVEKLDAVLSRGGELPDDWARARPRAGLHLGAEPLGGPVPGVDSHPPDSWVAPLHPAVAGHEGL